MKRFLSLLFFITICFVLSSCSVNIKEPKIKGDAISDEDVQKLIDDYNEFEENEEYVHHNKWYNYEQKLNMLVKEDETELNLDAVVKGEIYDAEYDFDKKMNLSLKYNIKGTMPDPSIEDETIDVKIKFTLDIKTLNGRDYVDLVIKAKTDLGSMKFKFSNNIDDMEEEIENALDMLDEIMDSEMVFDMMQLEIVEVIFELLDGENMIDMLESSIGEDEIEVFNKNNLYTFYQSEVDEGESYSEISKHIASFEFIKDSYQVKNLNFYNYNKSESDDSLMEMTVSAKVSAKLFGIVIEPLNKSKYNY